MNISFKGNTGGERGIRTLDTGLSPYASLAGKCLRPLGQLSVFKTLVIQKNITILQLQRCKYSLQIQGRDTTRNLHINQLQNQSSIASLPLLL